MALLFTEKGCPLEQQHFTWRELVQQPISKLDDDAYTRVRVILMNGIELEASRFSHSCARMNRDLQVPLAQIRRIEQHQATLVNWLIGADHSPLETTIGYEQVAIEITGAVAQREPDDYLAQTYRFGLLEDFDHLYRYANLMDLMGNGRRAEELTGSYTEITPGRPTIFEHRDPRDDIRRPMTVQAAHRQSILNAMTLVSAEQQTMNYYMTVGNRPADPLARALYLEIAQIEEQHVSHYESCLDPTVSWLTNWVLHENHECWLYWSCHQTEVDPRIKQIWELHLAMEIEHLKIAVRALEEIEGKDAAELIGAGYEAPMTFEENKAYLRQVVADQVELTAWDSEFLPISELPAGHRYFEHQAVVNAGGVPSEQVIERHRREFGQEYRFQPDGEHPVASLREQGPHDDLDYWRVTRAQAPGAQAS
jgi:hypothetical protein